MSGAARDKVNDRSSATGSAKASAAAIAERAAKLRQLLSDRTGDAEPAVIVRAPGRVNLIGEYTDFNLGFVLPAAIDLEVWIASVPWDRPQVELTSVEMGETMSFSLEGLVQPDRRERTWIDYVAATAWAMHEAGLPIRGFRGVMNSTVPVGSGLSSSAAVEMASSWALADTAGPRPEPGRMAAIAQRGENAYVGVNCGIMDQFASAAGESGHALLIDCRANTATTAPLPGHLSLVVCDTAAPRRLNSSAYNTRRQECETGVRLIAEREPDVRSLRDVTPAMLARNRDRLPEVVARRCEHIVNEDDRVIEAVEALAADDIDTVGRLFAASHRSLRDLLEVSSAELDVMVEIAQKVPGVVASRLTGAGFGGCTINLVERGAEDELRSVVADEYPRRTGLKPRVYVVQAVDGAGPLEEGR
jgi:galactokinase